MPTTINGCRLKGNVFCIKMVPDTYWLTSEQIINYKCINPLAKSWFVMQHIESNPR